MKLAGISSILTTKMSVAIATIAEFLKPFLGVVLMYANKKWKFWGEARAGCQLTRSNKVKVWRRCSGFLLAECCGWLVIVGSACVEIC